VKASDQTDNAAAHRPATTSTSVGRPIVPRIIGGAVALILILGVLMVRHAESKTNKVALSAAPKPVTTLAAKAAQFRQSRNYVGTIQPWIEAKVGPQFVSAYVASVLVRPGAAVKRGDVLATLDCRSASAASKAVSMQAQALAAQQAAERGGAEARTERGAKGAAGRDASQVPQHLARGR
jgi:multidrug efflux pump subunit AcrA (membrane-fusion protein)